LFVCILVRGIDNFTDARLHYNLSAFIAREQCNIDSAVFDVGRVLIENGIQLSMTN